MYLRDTSILKIRRCGIRNSKSILSYMHLPFNVLSLDDRVAEDLQIWEALLSKFEGGEGGMLDESSEDEE